MITLDTHASGSDQISAGGTGVRKEGGAPLRSGDMLVAPRTAQSLYVSQHHVHQFKGCCQMQKLRIHYFLYLIYPLPSPHRSTSHSSYQASITRISDTNTQFEHDNNITLSEPSARKYPILTESQTRKQQRQVVENANSGQAEVIK